MDRILYDKFHEAELARYDLGLHLPGLYYEHSDLIVVILSEKTEARNWAGLEWRAIQTMLNKADGKRIFIARFGHSEIEGMKKLEGFIQLDERTPEQIVGLILERLAVNEGNPRDFYAVGFRAAPRVAKALTSSNLPRLQHFFGREKELKIVADALSPDARTWGVLIDGPGGIGKTSLAVRAAELVPPDQFKRIMFVSAKEREMSPDGEKRLTGFILPGYLEMLNEVARLLNLPDIMKEREDVRALLILKALQKEDALLILDNLESLTAEDRKSLFQFLSRLPHGCKAIVTSRRRTDVDARIIRLERLGRNAALALLEELAHDHPLLARTSETERIQLYEETGGSPLLMRWIVSQLGRGKLRDVACVLDLLRHAPETNDPLEFIFGDLLETFTGAETKALAALTYFTQKTALKHIAELAGLSKTAAQTALTDLANRALVIPDDTEEHFTLVPMVADFLRKHRPEVVKETGNRLEQRAYALIVENGWQKHERFPVLDAAWPSVAPALPLFLTGPNDRLQTVCDALPTFLEFTGRWDEWLSLEQQAETRAIAAGDLRNAGWRAKQAGWVHSLRQQAEAVLACADRAATHWTTAKTGARERATAIRFRGIGHQLKQDYPAAIRAYREVLDLHRSLSAESEDVAIGLSDLATVEKDSGDLEAAERDFREALRVARTVGDAEGEAMSIGNLAGLALDRNDWPGAEPLAREALPLSEKLGRQELIAEDCRFLAQALVRQGKAAEALPYAQRAVVIYTRLGSPDLDRAQEVLEECEAALREG